MPYDSIFIDWCLLPTHERDIRFRFLEHSRSSSIERCYLIEDHRVQTTQRGGGEHLQIRLQGQRYLLSTRPPRQVRQVGVGVEVGGVVRLVDSLASVGALALGPAGMVVGECAMT